MPASSTIPERFDALAAAMTPASDRTALVESLGGQARTLGYRELRDRADALAATLIAHGVRPEDRVALHLDRSIEQIVAMLAVLKAGAAFVPISPDYPAERVRQLLGDSGAELVLTTASRAADPDRFGPARVLALDTLDASRAETVAVNAAVPPDAAAYVMYTSGSTGRPKGVVVTHRNLLNLVTEQSFSHFGPDETFLQLSPGSFDAAAYEIWGALLSGARLVLAGPTYQAIDEFEDTVRQHGVTAVFLTAALFHELVRGRIDAFAGLRRVVVGGDVLSPVRAAEFLAYSARTNGPELVNGYGPTETTTFALTHLVTTASAEGASVPIGTPLRNARAYLLDERLQRVAAGEEGDLWIAGDGVTRGYLGQPGRTATVYLPDPYGPAPGARMYRTGDRGRLLPDGTMEFLGRADDQVKVRGFRVEPGEIEQALLSSVPGVADAAVVARQDADGARYLVAHLVPRPGHGLDPTDVRARLADVLPAYLLPTRYVVSTALPLSPSGKVDRAALRALPEPTTVAPAAPVAPDQATADQQALAAVWAKVLGRTDVGIDDDFFALGGDSILAIRAIADAETAGLEISLAEMFGNPRISALLPGGAATPVAHPEPEPEPAPVPAPVVDLTDLPEGVESGYPATRLQLGLIFEAAGSPDRSLYHDVMAHRVDARLDPAALRRAVDHVAGRHEILRTRFDLAAADGPRQLVEREPRIELTVRDWRGLSAKLQEAALDEAAAEVGRPFDVEEGPLIRFFAAHLDDESFRLVYGFHHAIMDGWSDTVLLTDLMTAYAAALAGKALDEPSAAHRYADFVRLEREALTSDAARAFWTERCTELAALSPATPAAAASARGRRGPARSADRIRISHPLPAGLRSALERTAAQTRVPVKSLVVAAHLAVLGHLEGTAHPVTGIAVNGRPEVADADRLVGLFLNMVPIDAEVTERSWADVARQVFQAESALMEHRRYPYPALRELAGKPLFNTLINFTRFHLWNELSGDGAGIRLRETRSWDKTSFPLVVEAILDAVAEDMRIDVTADSTQWDEPDLERIWSLHLQALTALTRDPHTPAHVESAEVVPEKQLAAVKRAIAEVLEIDPATLGGADSFIGLGGTSLVAIAVASRLQAATGHVLTTADVLSTRSLDELADVVDRAPRATPDEDLDTSTYGAQSALLAPAQTAIWTHQQVSKDSRIYLEHVCYEVRGAVDTGALADAVERALAAHPVLGGAIETVGGTPRLVLGRHALKVETVAPARQPLSEAELRAVVERESLEGIDLDGGPLLRCVLIPAGEDRRLLLLVWHHLVMDGYSLRVLLADVESCYAEPRRRPTPAKFTTCDLNLRQLARVATPESASRVRGAAERVAHLEPLPLAASTNADEGTAHTLVISERLGRVPGLGAAATAAGFSIPVLISAAYQRAVGAVFGLGDFLTGCVTSGRVAADEEAVVGCFANTVLLAGDGNPAAPTGELLRRSAAELVRGLRDQDLPFTSVAGQLLRDVRPRPRYFPQLYLSMDVASPLRLKGLTTSRYRSYHTQAKFDAALILEYGPAGVCGMVQYRTPTLSQGTAEALVEALLAHLCAITDTITEAITEGSTL